MKVIHGIDEPLRRITVSLSRYFKGIDCIERMKNSVVCRLTKKENRVLVLATYMQLLLLMIQLLIYSAIGTSMVVHGVVLAAAIVVMLFCIPIWIRYFMLKAGMIYAMALMVVMVQFLLFAENRRFFVEIMFPFFCMCIPSFINISAVNDDEIHIDILRKMSWAIFVTGEIYLGSIFLYGMKDADYSMSYSYYMLLPSLIFTYLFNKEKKVVYLLVSIASFISMFMIGSRGASLIWVLFFVVSFLFSDRKWILKFPVVLGGGLLAFHYGTILVFAAKFLGKIGFESRTLLLLLRGEILTHDSGRNLLRMKAFQAIKANPFTGNGIGSDFRLLGTYTHNLFLDLFMHYGVVFGVLIVVAFMTIISVSFYKSENKMFTFLMFCFGFLPLMVSGTYLVEAALWIYLGYCCRKLPVRINFESI